MGRLERVTQSPQENFYAIGLTQIKRLGPVNTRKLVDRFGSAESVFRAPPKDLKALGKFGEYLNRELRKSCHLLAAEKEFKYAERNKISIRTVEDPKYPRLLKALHDAPFVLFQKGDLNLNEQVNIAIVGTRKPSSYGRILAEKYSAFFSERGINVVSGLAYGIDGAVHSSALTKGGKTTAVLGHGLQTVYPREHWQKANKISESGALLTEHGTQIGPDGRNFPMRNRIISGMCHATIVVEAGIKGGALITAKTAFEQNREVYAVPGDVFRSTSVGCNHLIRDQIAKILTDPQEVLDDIAPMLEDKFQGREKSVSLNLDPKETLIFKRLQEGTCNISKLESSTGLLRSELFVLLLNLEIRKVIRQDSGGYYRVAV